MPTSRRLTDTVAADPWQRLDRQLCFALYASSLAMTKVYKAALAPLRITYPQYLVLLALWEAGGEGLGVGELGERLCLDSGTLTPLLKRMAVAGLLNRTRAAGDERRVQVDLTAAGLALREPARAVPRRIAAATGLGAEEVLATIEQLHTLRRRLQSSVDASPAGAAPAAPAYPAVPSTR